MKRQVKVKDAILVGGRLNAVLAEDDDSRGWVKGDCITTSTVMRVDGNNYETRNTIYVVDGQVWEPMNQGE